MLKHIHTYAIKQIDVFVFREKSSQKLSQTIMSFPSFCTINSPAS